ncbi:MAG: AmmeMemoRadiSam system protein B [Thermodesulfobacteriota bacterium]
MKIISLILSFFFLSVMQGATILAERLTRNSRPSVWQGKFYPETPLELEQLIGKLTDQALKEGIKNIETSRLKALIMPHAGYIYSGLTASHAAYHLKDTFFKKVIIVGPDHRIGFTGCSVSSADAWMTPLGRVELSEQVEELVKTSTLFHEDPKSDELEHSVEVIVPFVQTYLDDFKLIPLVAGRCDINNAAGKINSLIDDDTILIISSDLSHYFSYEDAVKKDKATIKMILNQEKDKLLKTRNAACGKIPILILMEIAKKRGWKPVLLHYSNSGDTAGDKSRVVGYCAMAYIKAEPEEFSQQQGDILLRLARDTISQNLGLKSDKKIFNDLDTKPFKKEQATFVTLYLKGRLRGCIGSLEPKESIWESVKHNAVNAAFRDPRFSGLTREEFKNIKIEVSILTPPAILEYSDHKDLIAKLEPGLDGVIVKKGWASATYLPQVWEQLPDTKIFLSRLCQKAGLSSQEWKKGSLQVKTYRVQYFEEEH